MAGSFSNYLETKVLDYVFGKTSFTPADTLWIALSTGTTAEDGTCMEPLEASGYTRVSGANDKTTWTNAGAGALNSGELENAIALTFSQATGPWGTVSGFAIFDSSGIGEGNMYGWGSLTTPRSIVANDTPRFASGDLDITLS